MLIGKSIDIEYAFGCNIGDNNESGFAEAIELARTADIVICFGEYDQSVEGEGRDRGSITLPDIQLSLIQQLEKFVHSPLHVVIMSGSSIDLSYIRGSSQCVSLIWANYPGQSGGSAIANIIFGQYNPASYIDTVSMFDMSMRPSPTNPGRTYKFYTSQPVFEFGFGLSYTTFSYAWYNDSTNLSYMIQTLVENNSGRINIHLQLFRVYVTNTGTMNGDDVVLAYIKPPQILHEGQSPPIRQLFVFERIHLSVNETKQVFFPLNTKALFIIGQDASKWLRPGQYHIFIGAQRMFTIELCSMGTIELRKLQWESFNSIFFLS